MAWMIVSDSSCEIRELENPAPGVQFALVPFKIRVGEREYVDLATLNPQQMLQAMTDYNGASTTACPSPEEWAEYFLQADNVFAFTISSNLSGSYNAAPLAAEEYQQENPGKRGFVLDSLSTGPEQRLLAEHLRDLLAEGKEFDEICEKAAACRDRMNTYFVLESLDTLKKNGRLTGLQAFFATKLNIKPVMGADNGTIIKLDQARGIQKALQRMAEIAVKEAGTTKDKRLVIAHCNAPERAQFMKEKLCSMAEFKEVVITDTCGVSTVYASDGGVILAL